VYQTNPAQPSHTRRIADFVANLRYENIPEEVQGYAHLDLP